MERFAEITDDIFRGSKPTPNELRGLKDIFGVKKIISLDRQHGEELHSICRQLNLQQILLPIENDFNFKRNLQFLKNNITDLLGNNTPTFVHCYHGKDRTGLAVALFRIQAMGWNPAQALEEAKSFDFGIGVSPKIVKIYQDLIFDYQDSNQLDDHDSNQIVGGLSQQYCLAPLSNGQNVADNFQYGSGYTEVARCSNFPWSIT